MSIDEMKSSLLRELKFAMEMPIVQFEDHHEWISYCLRSLGSQFCIISSRSGNFAITIAPYLVMETLQLIESNPKDAEHTVRELTRVADNARQRCASILDVLRLQKKDMEKKIMERARLEAEQHAYYK